MAQSIAWPASIEAISTSCISPNTQNNGHTHDLDSHHEQYNSWYVVLTKPRQEQRAKENLERQGGEVYLPLFSNERIVRGKRVKREEPLFLGYLFLNIPTNSPLLSKVRSTFGVRQHFTGSLSGLSGDI